MKFTDFLNENVSNYKIFTFDNENNKWETFSKEFSAHLGINYDEKVISEDYFLYGGVVVLNHATDKLIFVPTNWNKDGSDYLQEKTKQYSELNTF